MSSFSKKIIVGVSLVVSLFNLTSVFAADNNDNPEKHRKECQAMHDNKNAYSMEERAMLKSDCDKLGISIL